MSGTGAAGPKACKIVFEPASALFLLRSIPESIGNRPGGKTMVRLRRVLGHVVSGFATAGMCVSGFAVAEA